MPTRATRRHAFWLTLALALPGLAAAEVKTETVRYKDGDQLLEGFLAYDDAIQGKRPGVLVVHEWWGLNDYAKRRARMLAELGYVAFAADMYGDRKVTTHADDAKAWMSQIAENQEAWQRRARAGLDVLRASDRVDGSRLAAIGYCFGGATVMQLAYGGADLKGVVSFHGSLPPATPEQAQQIKPSILIAHGEKDPMVPPERIGAFKDALDRANVDYEFVTYSGARHSFTNPDAASFGVPGLEYNAKADARSWETMQAFLKEVLAP